MGVVPTVPIVVHVQDKNKEDSDKVPNESSDEDWDELFPENTKVKNKKRGRTEAETVTPVKKKAKKSPGNAPTRKTARAVKTKKKRWESQTERRMHELRRNRRKLHNLH